MASENVSTILETILSGEDFKIRPDFDGKTIGVPLHECQLLNVDYCILSHVSIFYILYEQTCDKYPLRLGLMDIFSMNTRKRREDEI